MNKRVQPDLLAGSEEVQVAPPEKGTVGAVVSNGKELILVPEEELKKVDGMADKPAADPPEDFDWLTSGSVVVPEQQAVAVYFNPQGDLVIRQERHWCQEDDSVVIVHRDNASAFLDKLCDVMGVMSAP